MAEKKNDKSAYVKIFSRPVSVGKEDCQRHLRLNTTSCNWSYILIFIHYIMQLMIYWFSYTTSCNWSYILIFIHYIKQLIIYIDFHTLHHAIDHILIFIHYIMQLIIDIDFHTLHHALDHILIFIHYIMHSIIYIDFHTLHHAFDHIYWFSYTTSCNWSYILISYIDYLCILTYLILIHHALIKPFMTEAVII